MTQAQPLPVSATRTWGLRALAAAGAFVAAPFFATGLFRLYLPTWSVALICALVVPAVLVIAPRPVSRWLAAGWIVGCIADAVFLLWLFSVMGNGMADF